jgi:hypothetical protein
LKFRINILPEKIFMGRMTDLSTTVNYLRESAPRLHLDRTKSDEFGGFCEMFPVYSWEILIPYPN